MPAMFCRFATLHLASLVVQCMAVQYLVPGGGNFRSLAFRKNCRCLQRMVMQPYPFAFPQHPLRSPRQQTRNRPPPRLGFEQPTCGLPVCFPCHILSSCFTPHLAPHILIPVRHSPVQLRNYNSLLYPSIPTGLEHSDVGA